MSQDTPKPARMFTRRRVIGGALAALVAGGGVYMFTTPDPVAHYNAKLGYRLADVRHGAPVPQAFVRRLSPPLDRITDSATRKDVFVRILLPLVLAANEDRAPGQRIPVAMALAQGAIESGWGTARFTIEGNAIFGQRTWGQDVPGQKPKEAEGFRVQSFPTLLASVEAYMENLNAHREYEAFRTARRTLLAAGQTPTANALLPHITAYSEEGRAYVAKVRAVIAENQLTDFARARLAK